jgi:hypothetical protein
MGVMVFTFPPVDWDIRVNHTRSAEGCIEINHALSTANRAAIGYTQRFIMHPEGVLRNVTYRRREANETGKT